VNGYGWQTGWLRDRRQVLSVYSEENGFAKELYIARERRKPLRLQWLTTVGHALVLPEANDPASFVKKWNPFAFAFYSASSSTVS
jgi:hypothetical protein